MSINDSVNDQRESFSAALHEAARSFEPPRPELLYGDALRRGRRIRRNRTLGTGLAGVLVLAVAGVLALTLAGSGSSGEPAPGVTATVLSSPVTAQYMTAAFESVLPSNAKIDESATHPLVGSGYTREGTGGGWAAGVTATVLVSGAAYVLALSVSIGVAVPQPCMASGTTGTVSLSCESDALPGGPFDAYLTSALPGVANYLWQPTAKKSVVVSVRRPGGTAAAPAVTLKVPFTVKQIERLVTAKVWTTVIDDLPAVVG